MAIIGIGIDIVEVERIRRALERKTTGSRFAARIFTEVEAAYCESRGLGRYQSYAGRFAAKEAAMKALGVGWGRHAGWRDIEVSRERGRPPAVVFHGKAAELARRLGVARSHLSITHTAMLAFAQVILESP